MNRLLLVAGCLVFIGLPVRSDPVRAWDGTEDAQGPDWAGSGDVYDSWSRRKGLDGFGGDAGRVYSRPSADGADADAPYGSWGGAVATDTPWRAPDPRFERFSVDAYRPLDPLGSSDGAGRGYDVRADDKPDPWRAAPRDDRFGSADPSGINDRGYRFRGDPALRRGDWRAPDEAGQYRFRPLSESERDRMGRGSRWRPPDSERRGGGRPDLFDSMTPMNRAYGFEPGF